MTQWIKISQLQKQIDGFQLGPIDLNVEPGTITALVGNNGSGKSTLLKTIMNLVKQDHGQIKVFDTFVDGHREDWKKYIAYQPQTVVGYDPFTGETLKELIQYWYPNWDDNLFRQLIDEFSIPLGKRFGKLSQGAQQKLTFALTIARNTPILILDEPTAHMDIPSKRILIDRLVEWMDQDERTIIIASHQAEDIKKLSDYLLVLHDGQMVGHFEKDALVSSYQAYWINETLPSSTIPGEVHRSGQSIISNERALTEAFFSKHRITCSQQSSLELEEIIHIILANER